MLWLAHSKNCPGVRRVPCRNSLLDSPFYQLRIRAFMRRKRAVSLRDSEMLADIADSS